MIAAIVLLAVAVLLPGILTLTRIDRLERKIDELARSRDTGTIRPERPEAVQPPRTPRTGPSPASGVSGAGIPPAPACAETAVPTVAASASKSGTPQSPARNLAAPASVRALDGAPAAESADNTVTAKPFAGTAVPPPLPPSSRVRQTPPPIPAPVPTPRQVPRNRKTDYEKYIGENLFGKIGIFVLIVGMGFFVKYAIDNDWLGETMRTALGFAVGVALMGIAARLRGKYRSFSSLLAGGAFAVCFVTASIAYHYYGLFSQSAAFALLIVLTLLMTAVAWVFDRRELAVVALAGGLLAPFLASGESGNYLFLFGYLAILHTGMFVLSLHKRWWELPVVSFTATYLILAVFTGDRCLFGGRITPDVARNMLGFTTLFYALFALSIIAVFRTESRKVHTALTTILTLNNFFYLGFGLLFLSALSLQHKADGALPLFIAAANALTLWSVRRRNCPAQLSSLLLCMALLFATIAVPIQLRTHTVLVCWAAEAVVLVVLYIRTRARVYEAGAALLCLTTLLFGLALLFADDGPRAAIFRSRAFLSVLFSAIAFAAAAGLTHRHRALFRKADFLRYTPANALLIAGAFALFYLSFVREFHDHLSGVALRHAILLFTVASIAAAGYLLRNRFPIRHFQPLYLLEAAAGVGFYLFLSAGDGPTAFAAAGPWLSAGVVALILADVAARYYKGVESAESRARFTVFLNLLATLLWIAVVHRVLGRAGIGADFGTAFSAAMISAGTLQMTLGMRRHQKVLRVISLCVFAVVLAKLLVHDLWGLPTIGRIVVFILLGAVLLVLSFLYQRLKTALFKEDGQQKTRS